jgi:hypothetical protein
VEAEAEMEVKVEKRPEVEVERRYQSPNGPDEDLSRNKVRLYLTIASDSIQDQWEYNDDRRFD